MIGVVMNRLVGMGFYSASWGDFFFFKVWSKSKGFQELPTSIMYNETKSYNHIRIILTIDIHDGDHLKEGNDHHRTQGHVPV